MCHFFPEVHCHVTYAHTLLLGPFADRSIFRALQQLSAENAQSRADTSNAEDSSTLGIRMFDEIITMLRSQV
jgi:hypothetical protein